ncbi:MAG TPA: cyclic pyranopterin monophosphate synthase MoaC [Gemmatimonadales bacterium]
MTLTHVDDAGRARMVDVGGKPVTLRTATAEGWIRMGAEAIAMVEGNTGPKGAVLSTAELAGLSAAKRTAELIPLCHQIPMDRIEVTARTESEVPGVVVRATAQAQWRTGVEMEALTAVSVALLTVYDMVKAAGHDLEIGGIRLLEKSGGTRGNWALEQGSSA